MLIKPDGVERGLIGEILVRFERRGLKIKAMRMLKMSPELAAAHYAEHVGKPFYERLIKYVTRSPIVAIVLEGREAVRAVRVLAGATDPVEALPGTIRSDFAIDVTINTVHASDSVETAKKEIKRFFSDME